MKQTKTNPKTERKQYNAFFRYSGIATQMTVVIVFFVWLGIKSDEWLNMKFPVFTVFLSLAGVGIAIYQTIKDLIK